MVVSRQIVDGLNDLTVASASNKFVRAADLESLCGDFNMEEL